MIKNKTDPDEKTEFQRELDDFGEVIGIYIYVKLEKLQVRWRRREWEGREKGRRSLPRRVARGLN